MRLHRTSYAVGALIYCVGLSMILPLAWGLVGDDSGASAMAWSMLLTLAFGGILLWTFRRSVAGMSSGTLGHREGLAIVGMGWLAAGVCGALPYLIGGICGPVDALFESLSGFTTTGASILTDIEAVPQSILLWRSLTHWLGGMGIIVLSLAILPFLGVGGMQLYKAEAPGPTPDKLKPRIKDTAAILWKVYVGLSALQAVLLMLGGMSLFDSLCHTFGTMATGGFSTRNASVAAYDSAYIYWVITLFMLLAGINFTLHYKMLLGGFKDVRRDGELKFYLTIIGLSTAWIAWNIAGQYDGLGEIMTQSAFQVASIMTTTGFATADFEQWPALSQVILVLLMFVGGSAGSTGGGIKCVRIVLLFKHAYMELIRLVHPRAVRHLKLNGRNVAPEVLSGVWGFLALYVMCYVFTSILLAAMDIDLVTSFTATLACISNIGPGLGSVGPTDNYAHLPAMAKLLLTLCMVLGRLELYTLLILFVPEFWRK